jgi:hypothetical protein
MFKKKNESIDLKDTGNPDGDVSPLVKREARLEFIIKMQSVIILAVLIGAGVVASIYASKSDPILFVDPNNGEVIGEYRNVPFRTSDEIVGTSKRFAECLLSFTSDSVYEDQACALSMMSKAAQQQRIQWLRDTDFSRKIRDASPSLSSHLEFKKQEILAVKGQRAKVDLSGDIVITPKYVAQQITRDANGERVDYSVNTHREEFRMYVDIKMVPVTKDNTTGIEVVNWYDY